MPNPPVDVSRRYVDLVRERTGLDYTNIARLAGLNTTTLTRPLSRNGSHKGHISLRTLRRIAQVTGVPLPREIEPFPAEPADQVDVALAVAAHAPVGSLVTAKMQRELVRMVAGLIRRRE